MFRKVVKRMMFIHTFLIKLTNIIQIRLTPDPKTVDFAILQDIAYSDVSNRTSKIDLPLNNKVLLMEIVKTLFQPIDFHSTLLFIFGVFDLLFIFLFLFKIPYESCFKVELFDHSANKNLEKFVLIFSFFGILINFNTKYLSKGKTESSHLKIIKTYLKSTFIIDFLGFLGVFLHLEIDLMKDFSYWSLIYFAKVFSLEKLVNNVEANFSFGKKYSRIYSTIVWMLQFWSTIHFLSCIWYAFESNHYSNSDILIQSNLEFNDSFFKYLVCLYFVNSNVNLFGGSILGVVPRRSGEMFWILGLNFFSLGFLVYLYKTVFVENYRKELLTIHKFMKRKKISPNLQRKIDNYLQYFYEKDQKTVSPAIIINKMGDTLKKQLFIESYLPILKSIPFFHRNFTPSTLKKLSTLIIERTFQPGELITPESAETKNFYYILKGEVDVCFSNGNPEKSIKKLQKGDSFGELSLFCQHPDKFTIKSYHNSCLLMINSEAFMTVIKENQRDYEIFCNLRDEIALYGNYSNLYKACFFCRSQAHTLGNCPTFQYYPSTARIISTSYYKDKLSRRLFSRKPPKLRRMNALKNYVRIADTALQYHSNYSLELNTNCSRKKSISTSAPPIQRGRKRGGGLEDKKESIFNTVTNNIDERDRVSVNNTSESSYTQKKHTTEANLGMQIQNAPFASSDTVSVSFRNPTDTLSHKLFSIINENRMIYHNIYTDKSISSSIPGLEHSNERASKSSDFKNIDFNKLKKKNPFESTAAHFFDKQPVSSFSFEEVKIWPRYFPRNNVVNIIKNINKEAGKKTSFFLSNSSKKIKEKEEKEKEAANNKSKNSMTSSKINPKKSSTESLLKKKKIFKKSRTETDPEIVINQYERNKTVFERIKTFFNRDS